MAFRPVTQAINSRMIKYPTIHEIMSVGVMCTLSKYPASITNERIWLVYSSKFRYSLSTKFYTAEANDLFCTMPELLKKIKSLEKISRNLEPNADQRKEVIGKVVRYADDFLENLGSIKAYEFKEDNGKELSETLISEEPGSLSDVLGLIERNVDHNGVNPASPGYLAFIPGGGLYYSAAGDYLADVFNRFAGMYFASPGAVRMENVLLRWMAEMVGFPKEAAGNLSSGGSISNLIAVTTARDAFGIKGRDLDKSVIYHTSQYHHCLDKSIRIAGLKECIRRNIPMDERFRMKTDELETQIKIDIRNGLQPWLVIASAGTTDVGAVDPLEKIGTIAKKYSMWFHVDAAYGGFFALTTKGKKILKGIEQADSVVLDPHKGLFLPYGTGAVIVKDGKKLQASFSFQANYMKYDPSEHELSPAELSPELTKHFRGLRMWLPLMLHGLKPFRAALEEKLLLTKYFYEEIQKAGFEVMMEPELSVTTYRYVPETGDANEFNMNLLDLVKKDGRVFISATTIDGKYVLRMACLSFRTHLDTIDLLISILKEKVKLLEKA